MQKHLIWGLVAVSAVLIIGTGTYLAISSNQTETLTTQSDKDADKKLDKAADKAIKNDTDGNKAESESRIVAARENSQRIASESMQEESQSRANAEANSKSTVSNSEASSKTKVTENTETNHVFGPFSKSKLSEYLSDIKSPSGNYYLGSAGVMKVGVGVDGSGNVAVVKIDMRKAPSDPNIDSSHLQELAADWMPSDVTQTSNPSSTTFSFHSNSTGHDYKVEYTLNSNQKVTFIFVRQS